MSQEPEDDDLEPEYDFSGAVRGKYYQRYQQEETIETLVRPHVLREDLLAAYRDMAGEEGREAEAHDWAEATVGDVADETR